jgi:hypothetical protein
MFLRQFNNSGTRPFARCPSKGADKESKHNNNSDDTHHQGAARSRANRTTTTTLIITELQEAGQTEQQQPHSPSRAEILPPFTTFVSVFAFLYIGNSIYIRVFCRL